MPPPRDAFDAAVLRAAFEQTNVGIWTWQPDTGAYSLSPAALRLYGFEPGAVVDGRAVMERIHADDRAAFEATVSAARAGQAPRFADYRVTLANGNQRWLRVRAAMVQRGGRGGKARILAGTVEDATESHTAEDVRRTEQLFETLVQGTKEYAIFMLDANGRVMTWNAGATRVYGYARDQIVGQHFSRFYTPADLQAGKPERELEVARNVGEFEEEGRRLRKDGSTFWASVVVTALRDDDGAVLGFSKITRDITERRGAEEHAAEAARLREQNEFKARFINMAAHELQTPLTPIRINLTLLQDVYGATLSEDQAKCVTIIARNVDRLARLIDDILQAARLQADRLRLEKRPLDLGALANGLVESFADAAKQVKVALRADLQPDVRIEADAGRIEQVLGNLLTNALKFTPEGGSIVVRVRRDGGLAILEVQDSGIGMDPAQQTRLFLPFSQVHTDPRHQRGTGLGLFISKGIIEEHGGTIAASSAGTGMGSTFRITLPTTAKQPAPAPAPERRRGPASETAQRLRELI